MNIHDALQKRPRKDRCDATNSEELLRERFLAKVAKSCGDGCWVWVGAIHGKDVRPGFPGYGVMNVQGRQQRAHRISWLLFRGEIEEGKEVLHRCDNSLCVNPEHLFLGTKSENMKDCVSKGRHARAGGAKPGTANGAAKLDDDKVREARKMHAEGASYSSIARLFGVNEATIRPAIQRRTWKHVE